MTDYDFVRPNEDHSKCRISTGIHDLLTVGQGELDHNGFWERPCSICARRMEREHPECNPIWPHTKKQRRQMGLTFPETIYQIDPRGYRRTKQHKERGWWICRECYHGAKKIKKICHNKTCKTKEGE